MAGYFGGVASTRQIDQSRSLILLLTVFALSVLGLTYTIYLSAPNAENVPVVNAIVPDLHEAQMVDVIVPVRNIEPGTLLDSSLFKHVSKPREILSEGIIRSIEELSDQYALYLIVANHPFHRDFVTKEKNGFLPFEVPDGYVAVTIPSNALSSAAGFVRPGTTVGVNWIYKLEGGEQAVMTIIENAKVLACEQDATPDWRKGQPIPTTVTLQTTSEDAKKLQLAFASGVLHLVLKVKPAKGEESAPITTRSLRGQKADDGNTTEKNLVRICSTPDTCECYAIGKNGRLTPGEGCHGV